MAIFDLQYEAGIKMYVEAIAGPFQAGATWSMAYSISSTDET